MSILETAARLFRDNLGGVRCDLSLTDIQEALGHIFHMTEGEIDLAHLIGMVIELESSYSTYPFLSRRGARPFPVRYITLMFAPEKIDTFAFRLGITPELASLGLAAMIPALLKTDVEDSSMAGDAGFVMAAAV